MIRKMIGAISANMPWADARDGVSGNEYERNINSSGEALRL